MLVACFYDNLFMYHKPIYEKAQTTLFLGQTTISSSVCLVQSLATQGHTFMQVFVGSGVGMETVSLPMGDQ